MIGTSLSRIAKNDSLELLIQRAIPDAALLPELGTRVRERIVRLGN